MMQTPQDKYELEKSIWTNADFERMSWHDCRIHGTCFTDNFEFLLDIDYAFKWVCLNEPGQPFSLWLAPCTLVFENVYDIVMDNSDTVFEIFEVSRMDPKRPHNAEHINKEVEYTWLFELVAGEISFQSVGYKQYVRAQPVLVNNSHLTLSQRGGFSFEKLAYGHGRLT